jgi:hypothetical protein
MARKNTTQVETTNSRAVEVTKRGLGIVTSLVKTFTTSDTIHVRRARYVGALVEAGFSVSQIDSIVRAHHGVVPGLNRSSIGRYRVVYVQSTREDVSGALTTDDARAAVVGAFARLSVKSAELVTRAADEIAKAKGSAHAVEIAESHVRALNDAESGAAVAELQGAAKETARPVAGTADVSDKGEADENTTAELAAADVAAPLKAVGTSALIAELASRYAGTRASVHPDDAEALTALLSRVEALVTGGRVASKRR